MKRNNASNWPAPAKSLPIWPQFGSPVRHIPRDAAKANHNNQRVMTTSMGAASYQNNRLYRWRKGILGRAA
jgi:hypothetical protein